MSIDSEKEKNGHISGNEDKKKQISFIVPDMSLSPVLAELESICFPPNEACSAEMVEKRLSVMPELWLCARDEEDGTVAGFICGYASSRPVIVDEMFEDTALYEPEGKNIMILGVEVRPGYRGRGIASYIMEEYKRRMKKAGRDRLVLTCHQRLISFYERFGFANLGVSDSKWGGELWYDMECIL